MRRLVLRDLCFVLEREPDVVESFEQAVAREFVDGEGGLETLLVLDAAALQIDEEAVIGDF
jgi:hypothetical protein